jgi:hypothetical protein
MVGAYWEPRQETIEQCADRLVLLFAELRVCDPALAIWFERGRSRNEASVKHVEIADRGTLIDLLGKGRNRRDVGESVIAELGFKLGLWNQLSPDNAIGLNITCGLYWQSSNQNPSLSNHVILELPDELGKFEHAEYTSNVLAAVAKAWDPAWAGVMSRQAMNTQGFTSKRPFVDWMVYVPSEIDEVQHPSSCISLRGLGTILIVQQTPPSAQDAEEIQRVIVCQEAISKIPK